MITFNLALKYLVLSLFGYLFYLIIKPFIPAIVLALAFAIVFYPLSEKIREKIKLSNNLSAFTTVILTLFFIILPVLALVVMIGNEAINFAKTVDLESLQMSLSNFRRFDILGYRIDVEPLKDNLINLAKWIGSYLSSKSLTILSSVWNSIFLFFVFLLLYYYFLKDSKILLEDLQKILPYEKSQQKSLLISFKEISRTIFYGNLIGALIAGLVAYLAFSIFGFSGALIWALLAAIFSLIPTAGTLLVYAAGILLLVFTDGWAPALMMTLYFIAIELIFRENFIKSKILEDKLKFHPIMVFFALVGGVGAFGSLGLVYGPLIVTFLGALYQFYMEEAPKKR